MAGRPKEQKVDFSIRKSTRTVKRRVDETSIPDPLPERKQLTSVGAGTNLTLSLYSLFFFLLIRFQLLIFVFRLESSGAEEKNHHRTNHDEDEDETDEDEDDDDEDDESDQTSVAVERKGIFVCKPRPKMVKPISVKIAKAKYMKPIKPKKTRDIVKKLIIGINSQPVSKQVLYFFRKVIK